MQPVPVSSAAGEKVALIHTKLPSCWGSPDTSMLSSFFFLSALSIFKALFLFYSLDFIFLLYSLDFPKIMSNYYLYAILAMLLYCIVLNKQGHLLLDMHP